MESVICQQCGAPFPAGSAFCGTCGSRVNQPRPDPTTRLMPPAAPADPTWPAHAPPIDLYAAQYPAQPTMPALDWNAPPMMPQASPPRRKRSGRLIVSLLLLVVILLGAVGYLALRLAQQPAASANHSGATGGSASGSPSLPAINRQAIYAGAMVTIESASKAHSFPEFQKRSAGDDVVKVQAQIENQTPVQLSLLDGIHLLGPDGSRTEPSITTASGALPGFFDAGASSVGSWYFEVNRDQNGVGVYKIIVGVSDVVQETIPFSGPYDPSVWQWVTKPVGKSVTYHTEGGGTVIGTVVKVTTGLWTPGYQAPQGTRFVLTDMLAANETPLPVLISGNAIKLQEPGGVPESPATTYGYFINDSLAGGQNKDEGYASFVVPPNKSDCILFFYNPDGSVAGQIDLGTL